MLSLVFPLLRLALYGLVAMALAWFSTALIPAVHAGEAPQFDRQRVESVEPLLVAAITQGVAHGVLIGAAADAITGQFASRSPIEIDVTAGAPLVLPGCRRMTVDTHQDQVVDRERATVQGQPGKALPPKEMRLTYKVNFCADGTVPPKGTRMAAAQAGASAPQDAAPEGAQR